MAFAQDDYERATSYAEKGMKAFQNDEFVEAGDHFKKANNLFNDPTLAKSAMYSYYKGDACTQAVEAADELKRISPNQDVPKDHRDEYREVQVNCRISFARAELKAGDKEKAQATLNTAYPYGPNSDELAEMKELEAEMSTSSGTVKDPEPPSTEEGSNTLLIAGWVSTGVGAAILLGTSVAYLVGPYADINMIIDDKCGGDIEKCVPPNYTDEDAAAWDEAASDANGLVPFWIAGGVLTAAGTGILIYHYFISDNSSDSSAMYLAPSFNQAGAGAEFGFKF